MYPPIISFYLYKHTCAYRTLSDNTLAQMVTYVCIICQGINLLRNLYNGKQRQGVDRWLDAALTPTGALLRILDDKGEAMSMIPAK